MTGPFNVLFLCTGNSARSILAEAIANRVGKDRFKAYSAGSMPKGEIHPRALGLLESLGYPTQDLSSKSWEVFAGPDAPRMNFVFTVCDNAAGEVCPVWPGQPISAHWGLPDPAAATGSEAEIAVAFAQAYRALYRRIELLAALPMESLARQTLQARLEDIHRSADEG